MNKKSKILPELKRLSVYNYDVYKEDLEIDLSKKVILIFGNNGYGKSTLINILIYSIIGPYLSGVNVRTYRDEKKEKRKILSNDYFKKRMKKIILKEERNNYQTLPYVEVEFYMEKNKYVVRHSLYEMKLLAVYRNDKEILGEICSYEKYEDIYFKKHDDSQIYLIGKYQKLLYQDFFNESIEYENFSTMIELIVQGVYFGEDREYTFWNTLPELFKKIYLLNETDQNNYGEFQREAKYYDSLMRHKSEDIKIIRKYMVKETESCEVIQNIKSAEEVDRLVNERDKLQSKLRKLQEEKRELLIQKEKLVDEKGILESKWMDIIHTPKYKEHYEKFSYNFQNDICPFCGKYHIFSKDEIHCVMCGEEIDFIEIDSKDLIKLDVDRKRTRTTINRTGEKIIELSNLFQKTQGEYNNVCRLLDDATSEQQIDNLNSKKDEMLVTLNKLEAEKQEYKTKRDLYQQKADLLGEKLNNEIAKGFLKFEKVFIKYGKLFYGQNTDLSLSLNSSDSEQTFDFRLNGSLRKSKYELSESQRIFTDFAFRFSLLSTYHTNSFFICETPDSTLDLVHERNAANTFLEFIRRGGNVILTANYRQSQLLQNITNEVDKKEVEVIDLITLSSYSKNNDNIDVNKYIFGE